MIILLKPVNINFSNFYCLSLKYFGHKYLREHLKVLNCSEFILVSRIPLRPEPEPGGFD